MEYQVPSNRLQALWRWNFRFHQIWLQAIKTNFFFSKWNFTFHHNTASGHKYELELGVSPHSHMASGQIFIKQNFWFYQIWFQAKFLSHETSNSIKDDFMSNLYEMELQVTQKMTLCKLFNRWNFKSIKYGFRPEFSDRTSGSIKYSFRPNFYQTELQVHQT